MGRDTSRPLTMTPVHPAIATTRPALLLLLAVAGCAASQPVPPALPGDLPPLPRSSLVAVLAHRSELDLNDDQVAALEQADAELQQRLARLRAEGAVAAPPDRAGPAIQGPAGGAGAPPTGRPGGGTSAGPGGFQLAPTPGGLGGPTAAALPGMGGGQAGSGGPARRAAVRDQEALEARLDDADTSAFLKAEAALSPAQRERAREIATAFRERLFERRELLRGR